MGFVWPLMYKLHKGVSTKMLTDDYSARMPKAERDTAVEKVLDRWVYLHSPVHSAAYVLNPKFVGMDHLADSEVKSDFELVLTTLLQGDVPAVAAAIAEYHCYHNKEGLWSKELVWVHAKNLSPSDFWLLEGKHCKYLSWIAPKLLSLTHATGGAERNWSIHGILEHAQHNTKTLAMRVKLYTNQRLLDNFKGRGKKAIKRKRKEPKDYPMHGEDWSSQDESDVDGEIGEIDAEMDGDSAKKAKEGSAVGWELD